MDELEGYEPTDEEIKELEELMKLQDLADKTASKVKDRKIFTYHTESHWIGWLKINGITW